MKVTLVWFAACNAVVKEFVAWCALPLAAFATRSGVDKPSACGAWDTNWQQLMAC